MAIDLDIRIAVQRGHGIGDLLCVRRNVLTGDLEVHVGSVKDLARRPTSWTRACCRAYSTLVEVRGCIRRLEFGQLLAVGGLERVDLEPRAVEPRLGLIDGNLVWFRIDFEQELTARDTLIVLDGDVDHLAGNPGVDQFLGCADEGVVGRNIRLLGEIIRRTSGNQWNRDEDQQWTAQTLPQWFLWHPPAVAGCGTVVERSAQPGVKLGELRRTAFVDCEAGSHRGAG